MSIRNLGWALGLGLVLSGPVVGQNATGRDAVGEYAKGRVLVMPRAGLSSAEFGRILATHGGRARKLGGSSLYVVELPAAASETAVLQQLARHPSLKFAELDRRVKGEFVPNDPYVGSQWHTGKIGAPTAWDIAQGSGVVMAVLDTGVDATHPDLAPQIVAGWNFYDNNSNTADVHGHGTAVAGAAAAAANNATGVAGVAGQSRIMPIRIADANVYTYYSMVAQGLTYAADKGARVANISFSGVITSASVQSAAQYMRSKGGLVVSSAGNTGGNGGYTAVSSIIPVSATDGNDALTSFSSFGSYVAMSAPGIDIWTTTRGGGYGVWWGTSLAAPITAGTVALMMATKPSLSASQVESLLFSTAVDLGASGRDPYFGYGRVNAAAAVRAAAAAASTSDTSLPTVTIAAPLAGSTASGVVAVDVSASDASGIAKVELLANNSVVGTDSASPFAFSWDSRLVADGSATLTARAYDAAGNVASTSVTLNVANAGTKVADTTPPSVQIVTPSAGTVKGTVSITSAATDDAGAATVTQSLFIDGVLRATVKGGQLAYSWNTRKVAAGAHTLSVVARDAAGNQASTSRTVNK